MTPEITKEAIKAMSNSQLGAIKIWVLDEERERAEKHKQETLAKIRELARSIEVGIKIEGARGRPAKASAESSQAKAARQ